MKNTQKTKKIREAILCSTVLTEYSNMKSLARSLLSTVDYNVCVQRHFDGGNGYHPVNAVDFIIDHWISFKGSEATVDNFVGTLKELKFHKTAGNGMFVYY